MFSETDGVMKIVSLFVDMAVLLNVSPSAPVPTLALSPRITLMTLLFPTPISPKMMTFGMVL